MNVITNGVMLLLRTGTSNGVVLFLLIRAYVRHSIASREDDCSHSDTWNAEYSEVVGF
jgi:hypothetical protein